MPNIVRKVLRVLCKVVHIDTSQQCLWCVIYLKPKRSVSYITEKLSLFDKCPNHKFGCFNSLDMMTEEGRAITIDWIERRIKLK